MKIKKKNILLHTPKGTHDILPVERAFWDKILEKVEELASFYGFSRIETPHFEKGDIFEATLGEATDIVEKQMYTFKTRGGDSLTLRPEGTASIMRAYFEHGMHTWPQPVMLWYSGSFFRHENPQKGRFREFSQFGLEILGEDGAFADALAIHLPFLILKDLGLGSLTVHINSIGDKECRPVYRKELLAYYRKRVNYLCKDCKRRLKTNPLRLLDCKEPECVELSANAPQMVNYFCESCKTHYKEVLEFLDENNIPYLLDHRLVRGLDYYSRTVFEIFFEEEGSQKKGKTEKENIPADIKNEIKNEEEPAKSLALGGGGRYDYLGEMLGGKKVFGVGAAFGIERIVDLMKKINIAPKKSKPPKVFFIQLGGAAKKKSLSVVEEFRKAKIPLSQSLSKDTLKGQLKIASKIGAEYTVILGQKEAIDETAIVRDMESGTQETLPLKKVMDYLKQRLHK